MTSGQTPSTLMAEPSLAPQDDTLRPRRARGLVGEIVESLGNNIREGVLKSGDKLPTEAEIMARFDVSRTVVREALSKLQASGRVETRHGIGTFVIDQPSTDNFRIAAQDLSTVQLALTAFQASIDSDSDAVPPDFQFHMEVARATGNQHFADLMTYLGTMIIPRTRVNTPQSAPEGRLSYLQRVNGEHESIFVAIRNQDPEAARAAMRTHLANSRERLRKTQPTDASKAEN
jgi:GntR family transcriptional repressor for pyruvate dehydrogenase complex